MVKLKAFQIVVLVITTIVFFSILHLLGFFNSVKIEKKELDNDVFDTQAEEPWELTEKKIDRYLVDELSWQTFKNTVVFCSHEILTKTENSISIYAMCEEFVAGDTRLKAESGLAGPVLLVIDKGKIVSHQQPRDGNLYKKDIEEIFPKEIQDKILNYSNLRLVQNNKFKARDFFSYSDEYEIVEQIPKACSKHSDCETPADYLARSNCPYESRCIEEVCTVVCPNYYIKEVAGATSSNSNKQIIGGDKDEHNCIGSAGYTWCEDKQKCLRVWEEDCASIISNFEDCVEAGYAVMESYPRQCRVDGGEMFTEVID